MRSDSHIAVGSPTVRVATILAATMLLALTLAAAGAGAQQLLAADGPLVVAADGSGDYTTIQAAVDAADDGDQVLVKPGTYAEVVVIEKDITLGGDGPREKVIVEFTKGGPMIPSAYGFLPYGLMLVDSEAVVSDLTVRGPNVAAAFVFVGGAPTLERVVNELEDDFSDRPHTSVAVLHDAGGTIRDSLLDGPVWDVGGSPMREYEGVTGSRRFVVEGNTMDTGFWLGDVTDGTALVGNTILEGNIGLSFEGDGSVLVAENELALIELEGPSDGIAIRDNVVLGPDVGQAGIVLGTGAPLVEGNVISSLRTGILVPEGGSPTISGNRLEELGVGIVVVGEETVAVIEGNRFCDNGQAVSLPEGEAYARALVSDVNEVCDDAVE